jgi:hypothetical protein
MKPSTRILAAAATLGAAVSLAGVVASQAQAPKPVARYTAEGRMEFPSDYRTWVFLSSGMDMSYSENAQQAAAGGHAFDNVFVDRAAYEGFLKTGHWPEGTVFALEIRRGSGKGSINKGGQFQAQRLAVEVHVKDKRFESGWAFFPFRGEEPAKALPATSDCHVCHQDHGAVDTTFVQY